MPDNAAPLATLLKSAEDYSSSTIELIKLQAIDKSADVVSSVVSRLTILIIAALSVIILNIGLALFIGKYLNDYFYGFFIMGGFYALLAILIHLFNLQWIKYPLQNSIIRQLLK